jgi:ABC-type transport system involved in multi-copper enzyme maturation permease subunit
MSVFDKTYRRYTGEYRGRFHKIWAIAANSFRVQLASKRVRMIILLILCNLPVITFTLVVVFTAIFSPIDIGNLFGGLFLKLEDAMYTVVFFTYNDFPAPMIFLPIVFICAMNAGVIANDKKNNSLALYMSRPISRLDYVIGKSLSVYMVSAFVSIVPWMIFLFAYALLTGITGVEFAGSIWVFFSTIVLGLLVVLFIGSLVLMFSSMSNNNVLAGILGVLVLFLPSFITTTITNSGFITADLSKLGYFSLSQLIRAAAKLLFRNPTLFDNEFADGLFSININGGVAIVIILAVAVISFLVTVNNAYKEEID